MRLLPLLLWAAPGVYGQSLTAVLKPVLAELEKMHKELAADEAADNELQKKMKCYCEGTDGDKLQAITDAEHSIAALEAAISKGSAQISTLEAEITTLTDELAKETKMLLDAKTVYEKETADFQTRETDLVNAIAGLGKAVDALRKHQANDSSNELGTNNAARDEEGALVAQPAFLQQRKDKVVETIQSLAASIQKMTALYMQNASDKMPKRRSGLTTVDHQVLTKFFQQPTFGNYVGQSGKVFAILEQMHEEFTQDLEQARQAQADATRIYGEMKAEKEALVATMTESKNNKEEQKGNLEVKKVQDEDTLAKTVTALGADQAFLLTMRKNCKDFNTEYQDRVNARTKEQTGVSQALKYLKSDEARAVFDGVGDSFIQRQQASTSFIQISKKKSNDIKVGAFEKVITKVDALIEDLTETRKQETHDLGMCNADILKFNEDIAAADAKRIGLEAQLTKLTNQLAAKATEKEGHEFDIKETKKNMGEMTAMFEQDTAEFIKRSQERDQALVILGKAKEAMSKAFAFIQGPPSFLQTGRRQGPKAGSQDDINKILGGGFGNFGAMPNMMGQGPPNVAPAVAAMGAGGPPAMGAPAPAPAAAPAAAAAAAPAALDPVDVAEGGLDTRTNPGDFDAPYEKHASGNVVVLLFEGVIADTEAAKADDILGQQEAHNDYEVNFKASKESLDASEAGLKSCIAKIGELNQKKNGTTQEHETCVKNLELLNDGLTARSGECEFLIKNYQTRQDHMEGEIKALTDAKGALQGLAQAP